MTKIVKSTIVAFLYGNCESHEMSWRRWSSLLSKIMVKVLIVEKQFYAEKDVHHL